MSLVFVRGIYQWLVDSPHKGPVTRNMFPFDDIMILTGWRHSKRLPLWLTTIQVTRLYLNQWLPSSKTREKLIKYVIWSTKVTRNQWLPTKLRRKYVWFLISTVLSNRQAPSGAKAPSGILLLLKPMLTTFHPRKCIWKCFLQNSSRGIPASICPTTKTGMNTQNEHTDS